MRHQAVRAGSKHHFRALSVCCTRHGSTVRGEATCNRLAVSAFSTPRVGELASAHLAKKKLSVTFFNCLFSGAVVQADTELTKPPRLASGWEE